MVTTTGQKLANYKHLALNKTKNKSKVRRGFARTVHFVVAMEKKKQGPNCFTNPDKNKTFPLNQNMTCANYGIDVQLV